MDKSTYSFKSCIQGYHEYRDIWDAAIGEVLDCEVGLRLEDGKDKSKDHVWPCFQAKLPWILSIKN